MAEHSTRYTEARSMLGSHIHMGMHLSFLKFKVSPVSHHVGLSELYKKAKQCVTGNLTLSLPCFSVQIKHKNYTNMNSVEQQSEHHH